MTEYQQIDSLEIGDTIHLSNICCRPDLMATLLEYQATCLEERSISTV